MAIRLRNSAYIHIPKTGGRWVGRNIVGNVLGAEYVGCAINNAHESPDFDVPVFAFVRHPIPLLNSLWHHRKRKKWNWDTRIALERECACKEYIGFYKNVINNPGIVKDYFDHFTSKYDDISWGRTEYIANDLIMLLHKFNETFDESVFVENKDKRIGHYCNAPQIASRTDIVDALINSESELINLWSSI